LYYDERIKLEGMYGLGHAFPEKWIDPSGVIDEKVAIVAFQEQAKLIC
jgi:hypothetical protein